MAAFKQAPLETFLTGVSGSAPNRDRDKPAQDGGAPEARNLVILTILGQATGGMPDRELAKRSELRQEWYEQALKDLQNDGLIERTRIGYEITDRGRQAADEAHSRLFTQW